MIQPEDGIAGESKTPAETSGRPVTPFEDDTIPGPESPTSRNMSIMWLSIACYIAFINVVPLIPFHPGRHLTWQALVLLIAPTVIFMLLQLWVPWTVVRIRQSVTTEMWQTALFAATWIGFLFIFPPHRGFPRAANILLLSLSFLVQTLTLARMGSLLARIVREAKILLPLGFIAGLIDIIGAMTRVGFTNNVMRHHPEIVAQVSVAVPTVHGLRFGSSIGPGDLLFIAFFFAVVQRHNLNLRWTFRLVYIFLTISMLAVQFTPVPSIGALAPMGIAVIISNARYFEFTREEKFAMLYAGLIAFACTLGFFFFTNALFHHRP